MAEAGDDFATDESRSYRHMGAMLTLAVVLLPLLPYFPWIAEVTAAWITIGVAWLTGVLYLTRNGTPKVSVALSVGLTVALLLLGLEARPTTRSYSGELNVSIVERLRQRLRGEKLAFPRFEIGESGQFINWLNVPRPAMIFFDQELNSLDVELVDGRTVVTTTIRNHNGDVVATIDQNKWSVTNNQSAAWDFNYSSHALEITDENRKVLFQMVVDREGVHLQGEWRADAAHQSRMKNGTPIGGVRLVAMTGEAGLVINPELLEEDALTCKAMERSGGGPTNPPCGVPPPEIERIFKYPGSDYLGQRVGD